MRKKEVVEGGIKNCVDEQWSGHWALRVTTDPDNGLDDWVYVPVRRATKYTITGVQLNKMYQEGQMTNGARIQVKMGHQDFLKALNHVKVNFTQREQDRYERWAVKLGEDGDSEREYYRRKGMERRRKHPWRELCRQFCVYVCL